MESEDVTVTLVGNKNKTRYTLIAVQSLEKTADYGANISGADRIVDGKHVNGYINKGGRDSYRLDGGIDALEVYTDTPPSVLLDGNEVPMDEITMLDLPHRLTVNGDGEYQFETTGSLRKGWHTSQNSVDYQRGTTNGKATREDHTYLFSGHVDHASSDGSVVMNFEMNRGDK